MLRITENFENRMTVRLRLDGTISNDGLAELINTFATHHDGAGRTVILDMAGVAFLNAQVARELISLRGDHLRIINCSPFIATLLDTIAKEKTD